MKKGFVLLFGLFAAGQVFATTACNLGQATIILGNAANFVITDISPKCSANTFVEYDQNGSLGFAVAGTSNKGKNIFSGDTSGGTVSSVGICTLPCDAGQLVTPLATAKARAT